MDDSFGRSVSLLADASTILVGAPREDTGGTWAGAVYVFSRAGAVGTAYTQTAKLQASDRTANAYFGHSVSHSGDGSTILVGTWDQSGQSTGSVYVFTLPKNDAMPLTSPPPPPPLSPGAFPQLGADIDGEALRCRPPSPSLCPSE